ncbi:MAG: hypothetical protein AAGI38_19810 [Bacteroidota bacterium]
MKSLAPLIIIAAVILISACSTTEDLSNPINQSGQMGKNGLWITQDDTTGMLTVQYFRHDINHGIYTRYHTNGFIAVKGKYKHGKKVGLWKYYLNNGSPTNAVRFRNGKRVWGRHYNPRW